MNDLLQVAHEPKPRANPLRDTWGRLPAVTLPMQAITVTEPALPTVTPGHLKNSFAYQPVTAVREALANAHHIAEAERWANWGAARQGARTTLTLPQKLGVMTLTLMVTVALIIHMHSTLIMLLTLTTGTYLFAGCYKVILLARGERATAAFKGDIQTPLADDELPLYTILVPLHREGKILPYLVKQLSALDYPTDQLEVLLLIESDDDETRQAVHNLILPPHIRPLTVPSGLPRTKPRALNVGLARARGAYIVVYDAEDRPEPDQLRKAAAAFHALPRRTVCLQARLNFYNARQSALARLFAVDYVQWYYTLLPGLVRSHAFVPLGGTSNHFRIEALRRLGGWDPFNVTEDCDLGARICRAGLDVAMLDSTTWEEAVTRTRPWIKQRSRWVKGYIQTYFVHMRHPLRLWRELGPRGFLDFQSLVGGASLMLLINPLMWLLTILYIAGAGTSLAATIRTLFPTALYYPSLFCFVVGNFIFFYIGLYACVRQEFYNLARYALLSPFYWMLMSLGAWMGVISLLRNPHYWAKTEHGLCVPAPAATVIDDATVVASPIEKDHPHLTVIIPAYNEVQRLPDSLLQLRGYLEQQAASYEVIVVDDGSEDGTDDLVQEWMRGWPRLRLVRSKHRGKGGAIRQGVFAARGRYLAFADADFSMPVTDFDLFRTDVLGDYDIAIASREGAGAHRYEEPRSRYLMSRAFNLLVRVALLPGLRDTQCGFKFLRHEVALQLCERQTIEGWGFDVELLYIARLRGYHIHEVPISWYYKPGSRIKPHRDAVRMLREVGLIHANGAHGLYDDDLQILAHYRESLAHAYQQA